MQLVRLIYASQSNLSHRGHGVDLEIGRILTKSKRNNAKRDIGGVLYHENDHFFQVLEGPEAEINAVYQTIRADERHRNAKILRSETISRRRFGEWSMNYITRKREIALILKQHKLDRFDPFQFNDALIDDLLDLFAGRYQETDTASAGWLKKLKARIGLASTA